MAKKKNKKKKSIDFKYNLKLYFGLLRKYKGYSLILIGLILLIEASRVAEKLFFKFIVDNGTLYAGGSLGKEAFISILVGIFAGFIGVMSVKTICKFFHIHFVNKIDAGLMADLKRKFFNHIVHLSHKFHTTHKTGSMISRVTRGGGAIERMTDVLVFNALPLFSQFIFAIGAVVFFDIYATITLVLMVFVFIGYSLIILQFQKEANVIANEFEDREKGNIADIFTNIDSIKYFGKEARIKNRFFKISEKTRKAFEKHWDYYRYLDAGHAAILSVGTFFLLYFPLLKFIDGQITIGSIAFIYTVYFNIAGHLFGFVHGIRGFFRSMADFESLFQYYKIDNDIKDKSGAKELVLSKGTISFNKLSFAYHKKKLFRNFNLQINENQKIALVGHSGSGKSTLVKLLYRLYDVDAGEILIDGKNIKDVKQESLRSELSIVPQECVLFDDTIFNNIQFSNPQANRKEVFRAMRFSQLDKIVKTFPLQEKTIVGERGVKLSGGEKQRVSIARALLADKKILVLDEATSSLDSETEHEIQKALEKLMHCRTTIIIAHRLSTIMKADKIIVLDKGRIVQTGTHQQLIKQKGQYKKLWNLQKGGYLK